MGRPSRLGAEGAELALCDVDAAGLEETARLVEKSPRVSTRVVDVADRHAVDAWARLVEEEHGGAAESRDDDMPEGMEYPAILRHSGHIISKAFWIGVKDWTDPQGQHYPYYVARIGPISSGLDVTFPIQNKLIET